MKIFLFILSAIVFYNCSSNPTKDPGSNSKSNALGTRQGSQMSSIESKQLATEEESSFVTEISFPRGESTMTKSAMDKIRILHQKAARRGKVEEVKVITWADEEYPSVLKKKLSTDQRKIVTKRNHKLGNYIGKIDNDAKIELFSMAERPGVMKSLFSSQDARIKKSLETAGISNTDKTVKIPGKASKSIVIFVMEE